MLLALASLFLTACGGTSNNAQAPADTKTTIKVENPRNLSVAHGTVITKDDQVLFDADVNCQSDGCYLYLPAEINQGVTVRYVGSDGRMIGAFQFPSALPSYSSIRLTKLSTGLYLVDRLLTEKMSKDGLNWQELITRLQTFFTNYQSPDGTPDPFEEVGMFYAQQMKSPELTEEKFLDELRLRLLNWDVASANELPTTTQLTARSPFEQLFAWFDSMRSGTVSLINIAHAQQAGGCSAELQTFLGQTQNVGGMFPYIGGVVQGVMQIFQDGCGTSSEAFASVLAKLDTLQASIDMLGNNVGALTSFLTSAAANTQTVQFENLRNRSNEVASNYQQFLKRNKATSLLEYFEKQGGWNQGIAAGGANIKEILYAPSKPSGDRQMLQVIADVTGNANFSTYLDALKSRCSSLPNSSTENFITVRGNCNAIIASNSAFLLGAQTGLLPIFKDIYAVLNKYQDVVQPSQAIVANDFPLPPGVSSYASAVEDIKKLFNKQQTKMVADYRTVLGNEGFFNIYDGLNTTLMAKMVERDCAQAGDAGVSKYPAITGWFAPNTNVNDNYIVSECKNSYYNYKVNANSRSKARYYYNSQGRSDANDPANVLGVLVPSGLVIGAWREYDNSVKTDTYKDSGYKYWGNMPWVVAYNNESRRDQTVVKFSKGNGGSAAFYSPRDDQSYKVRMEDWGQSATNFTWVSFIDKDGFSYAVYLMFEYSRNYRYTAWMACVSYDCQLTGDSQALKFKNGPEVEMVSSLGQYIKY
jgi:hypothetical protein